MNQASIFGTWQSDFGPVEFVGSNESFAGSWNQGSGKIGQILAGRFDTGTRILTFTYRNHDGALGEANMTLSIDGRRIDGTWYQQDANQTGEWHMWR